MLLKLRCAVDHPEQFHDASHAIQVAKVGAEPLPNVWLGVSIESWRYNWRADVLRRIPAAVRFISAEPLLDTLYPGTVDVTVLPPISVADWTREDLDERMEGVRQLFRETLQHWPG